MTNSSTKLKRSAGSVLLFAEALIHSTTAIRSDKERVILISGYTPPMVREWPGNEVSPEFIETLPEDIRPLISGATVGTGNGDIKSQTR